MRKALVFAFTGLCVLACVLDVAWRAFGSLTVLQVSVGSGAFLAVIAAAPFFMKPSDADLNDIGIVPMDDEDEEAAEVPARATKSAPRIGRIGQVA